MNCSYITPGIERPIPIMNKIIKYFDLVSQYRVGEAKAVANPNGALQLHWLPQYVALVIGVFFQPLYKSFMETQSIHLEHVWMWAGVSIFIGLIIFPVVYKGSFDPTKPIFVQLCVIFTGGLGWQSLIGTAMQAATAATGHPLTGH
jgi:hypothetical protein